jgi:fructose-1,6-bisphosphatase I
MEIVHLLEKAFIEIADLIRSKNSISLSSHTLSNNNSGDDVKELDILSNSILMNKLMDCNLVRKIGSEEEDTLCDTKYKDAPYLVCYDPLDGSSNIDVNITTGTIFCIYKYNDDGSITNGHNIVASGYCIYGGATQYLLAQDDKLRFYQLSPHNKCFELLNGNLRINQKGPIYSINEANRKKWSDNRYEQLIEKCIDEKYTARWVGCMAADGHRTVIKGGIFAYPGNEKDISGKIRLLYEGYPFAHIFHIGGGFCSNGDVNILDIPFPTNIHQKTPIILGGNYEKELFDSLTQT